MPTISAHLIGSMSLESMGGSNFLTLMSANQLKFWHGRDEVIEVERLQCARDGILSHTDSTSCVNDEYSWCCHLAFYINVSQFECKNSKKKSSMKKSCIFFRLIQKEMLLLQPI